MYISRMGICMEKAIVHDLLDIMVNQLCSDLFQIVALFFKHFFFIDRISFDIFHHQNMMRCKFLI